jgi:hypothetical protein
VAAPVTEGSELSTKDVDPRWLADTFGIDPDPERPLSQADGFYLQASVAAGETSTEVTVPTVKDTVAEPAESVRFPFGDEADQPQEGRPELTGTVLDAP